jgi:hypothetical protein
LYLYFDIETGTDPDLFMTVEFETAPCRTTPEKPAMPLVRMYGKTVRLNTPEIRSMDETHVHKDPSGPLDREKTLLN